ncbi:hypothetical protein Tco_1503492 [Tanacetum coccineum]
MKHGSDIFERPITELVQLVQAHQPVSLDLVLIDYALRIIVSSVWGKFCDAGFERLLPSDIQLLLVAFDSQLKVFHPLENQNASVATAYLDQMDSGLFQSSRSFTAL